MDTIQDKRRARIERGAEASATLAARADKLSALIESGHNPVLDTSAPDSAAILERLAQAESMAADKPRQPTAKRETKADAALAAQYNRALYVPIGYLLADLRARVKSQTRGFTRAQRADLATDALLLLQSWTTQGAIAPFYISPRGQLPMRRHWYDVDRRTVISDGRQSRPAPCTGAEAAMRAAIKQAANARDTDTEVRLLEAKRLVESGRLLPGAALDTIPLDAESSAPTLAIEAMRREDRRAELAPVLPDTDAPELYAQALDISLTEARTLVARGYELDKSPHRCAELWQVSEQRATDILSIGKRALRKRWPESADLVDAANAAAPQVRTLLAERASWRLADLSRAPVSRAELVNPQVSANPLVRRADDAVRDWRAAMLPLSTDRRAIELAAARAGFKPTRLSATDYVRRYLTALAEHGATRADMAIHGSASATIAPLNGPTVATWHGLAPRGYRHGQSSRYGRELVYSRAARADIENRPINGAIPIAGPQRTRMDTGAKLHSAELAELTTRVAQASKAAELAASRAAEYQRTGIPTKAPAPGAAPDAREV